MAEDKDINSNEEVVNEDATDEVELPVVPLFGKWDLTEVNIEDKTLEQHINLNAFQVPHTGGRHSKKRFGKRNLTVIERMINNLMRSEKYTGKKAENKGFFDFFTGGKTRNNTRKNKRKTRKRRKKQKKQFLYNPNDPSKSFDVYIDKNPNDTIPIKYTTVKDVKDTISKLERLYKTKKYPHKRIWQVGMIMKVRLEAMKKHKKTRYPNAKNVTPRFNLANKYFKFLGKRSKKHSFDERKNMVFKF